MTDFDLKSFIVGVEDCGS